MAETITKYLQQFIDENVNRRYSYVEYNSRDKNLVIDSSCPLRICQDMNASSLSNTSSYHAVFAQNGYNSSIRNSFNSGFPKDSYAISEAFANRFMVKRIPLEILVNALGFTKKDISELLASVKARRYSMVFVDFGGTGFNTHYWLSEMAQMCMIDEVFNAGIVYDADFLDFTNILRFPADISKIKQQRCYGVENEIGRIKKTDLVYDNAHLYRDWFAKFPEFLTAETKDDYIKTLGRNSSAEFKCIDKSTIFYGAPDLATREILKDVTFIAGTHGDNECSLHMCPEVDTQLQQESYGMIQLNVFFMNQLRMAIALLEILSKNTKEDLAAAKNVELFKFDFSKFKLSELLETPLNFNIKHNERRR